MGNIFLNYRRADAEAWADRIYERLLNQLPSASIFMDIDGDIPLGLPWAQWLDSKVVSCDLMLVLIGRSWVSEFEARSEPNERDFVRVEIECALARKIPVVPVLLGDTPVPVSYQSAHFHSIRPLLDLQATRLHRSSFETDVKALIDGIGRSIRLMRSKAAEPASSPRPSSKPTPAYSGDRRIKVEALIIEGAGEGWFTPGEGREEWFKDHDLGPEMVVVPAGSFLVGSPDSRSGPERGPQHKVRIARPFGGGRGMQ